MKIVHIAPSLSRGGGERLMIELANAASADGHEVSLVLGFELPPERLHEGLSEDIEKKIVSGAGTGVVRRYFSLLKWLWRHRQWLATKDVIHCHMTFGAVAGTLARWMMQRKRRPAIVETYHAVGMPISASLRWLHARLAAGRDGLAFMVDHPYWREFLDRRPHIAASIIAAGVPVPPIDRLSGSDLIAHRRVLGLPDQGGFVIGTIGRLVAERQPWLYIPAFARIGEEFGDAHFVIGGDGTEEARLRRMVTEHGLEGRVHFLGLVRNVDEVLSALDLYLTLNVGSVPGVAGLQAVAAGVPVIAIQGQEDHESRDDWVWSSHDPLEVGEKAIELLRSRPLRTDLAKAQRAHLEANHSSAAMSRGYEALYRRAIGKVAGRNESAPA